MKKILLGMITCVVGVLLTSCASGVYAKYDVGLQSVEKYSEVKQQNNNKYEDEFIEITWSVLPKQFNFELKNKTDSSIKINWDEVCYVDYSNRAKRVIHTGVRYLEKNNAQVPTIVPKGAILSDILLPTDNVHYVDGKSGGWNEQFLIPSFYLYNEELKKSAPSYVGSIMKIVMPIVINGASQEYVFTFRVNQLLSK